MATPTTTEAAATQSPAAQAGLTDMIRVAVPERGLRQDLRATGIVAVGGAGGILSQTCYAELLLCRPSTAAIACHACPAARWPGNW